MQENNLSTKSVILYWWLLTILIIILVLFPIYYYFPEYPLMLKNGFFILVFISLSRFVFFLKDTWIAKRQKLKILLFFLMFPLAFYFIQELFSFQALVHDGGLIAQMEKVPYPERKYLANYIRNEYLFFLTASVVSAIVFAFRLLQSVWLLRNRGRV